VYGSVPLIILAVAIPGDPIQWNFDFIWSLIFSALIGTALAGIIWLYILNSMPANMAGIGTIGTPVIGVLASWLQLGETLSPWEIAGMVLVVSALALLVLRGAGIGRRAAALPASEQEAVVLSRPPMAERPEG
jgi:drug/metabolite transporter (DMT)-like permease